MLTNSLRRATSVVSWKFGALVLVGRTPSSALDPWSSLFISLKPRPARAPAAVQGDRPTFLIQDTSGASVSSGRVGSIRVNNSAAMTTMPATIHNGCW